MTLSTFRRQVARRKMQKIRGHLVATWNCLLHKRINNWCQFHRVAVIRAAEIHGKARSGWHRALEHWRTTLFLMTKGVERVVPRYARHHRRERFSTALTGVQTFRVHHRYQEERLASTLKAAKGGSAATVGVSCSTLFVGFPTRRNSTIARGGKNTVSCNFARTFRADKPRCGVLEKIIMIMIIIYNLSQRDNGYCLLPS